MKVNGSATVSAPLPLVWDALQDPMVLARTIPGCRRLEATGGDTYEMTVTAGVASIKGTYVGQVALAEPEPPHAFVLRAKGQGAPGTVDATVRVRLSEGGQGVTAIDYDADAVVGGMIGGVGQRMLGTVAKRTATEFFTEVERLLTGQAQAVADGAGAVAGPGPGAVEAPFAQAVPAGAERVGGAAVPVGTVFTAPERERGGAPGMAGGVPAKAMLAAFGAGGSVALAGVLVGYLLGRRARR